MVMLWTTHLGLLFLLLPPGHLLIHASSVSMSVAKAYFMHTGDRLGTEENVKATCDLLGTSPSPKEGQDPSGRPPSPKEPPTQDPSQPLPPTEPILEGAELDLLLQLLETFRIIPMQG